MPEENCIFCKIASKQIPSRIVYEDEQVFAFHDLSPQAPIHVLLIPKVHLANIADTDYTHKQLLGALMLAANKVAEFTEISESGYRVVANVGSDGGQSVDHLHYHVLGGRHLKWPPG
jgi:histidine triad (HIT) family protein